MRAAGYTQVPKAVTDKGTPGSPGSARAAQQGKQLEGQWHKLEWWEGVFTLDTEAQGQERMMGNFTFLKTQSYSLEFTFRCRHRVYAALCTVPVIFTQIFELLIQ